MIDPRFQGPLCPDCGYDLREQFAASLAARVRCPECGAEPSREEARLRWVPAWVRTTPWVIALAGLLAVAVTMLVGPRELFGLPASRAGVWAWLIGLAALAGGTFAGWSVFFRRRYVLGWFDRALIATLATGAAWIVALVGFSLFT
ncbi:MAG: hypothetical protein K2Q20_14435 [Phycisphaerales bacterium]|nr:hypothetical protein [Phycisphaerales bacterium]